MKSSILRLLPSLLLMLALPAFSLAAETTKTGASAVTHLSKKLRANTGTPQVTAVNDLETYTQAVEREVQDQWQPPKHRKPYNVTVGFSIDSKGNASNIAVEDSSDHSDVDSAACKAVQNAAPFNPLPGSYRADNLKVTFTLDNTSGKGLRFSFNTPRPISDQNPLAAPPKF